MRGKGDGHDRVVANLEARRANADLCLRIGYLSGAARPFLPKLVRYMEKEHPEVELDLRCMEYGELAGEHVLLPDEQSYPGLAQRYERIAEIAREAAQVCAQYMQNWS